MKLTEHQWDTWAIDGYLHLGQALTEDEVAFFSDELDRIRLVPGYEPGDDQLGHYSWVDHAADTDPRRRRSRRT